MVMEVKISNGRSFYNGITDRVTGKGHLGYYQLYLDVPQWEVCVDFGICLSHVN